MAEKVVIAGATCSSERDFLFSSYAEKYVGITKAGKVLANHNSHTTPREYFCLVFDRYYLRFVCGMHRRTAAADVSAAINLIKFEKSSSGSSEMDKCTFRRKQKYN